MTLIDASGPFFRFLVTLFVGAGYATNGVLMLVWTQDWYACIAAASALPAFNAHFVTDTGAAYLVLGLGLAWSAWRPQYGLPLTLVAFGFTAVHAALHVRDYLSIGLPTRHWLIEAFGIWGPVLVLAWLAAGTLPRGRLR